MTSPFKTVYFRIYFLQNYRSYNHEKVPNISKMIFVINMFIVASLPVLFSYGSHSNTKTNKMSYLKIYVHFKLVLPENQKCNYLNSLLHIAKFYTEPTL